MTHQEIRDRFRKFFEDRKHTWVPSSSLLPDDPSVLFTTAGMQQFKLYYTGQADAIKDFGSLNTASIQKSMRTSDIDEVGDESHLTFFEMLGNFSFGGYFKEKAIQYGYEFITKEMGLNIDYISVFGGESDVPADEESEKIWKSIDPNIKVVTAGRKDNFWGPTGNEGPCGPTSEIYVNGLEIWNLVFNQYYQHPDGRLEPLKTPGVDTGMGLERLAMVAQRKNNIYETDLFEPIIKLTPSDMDTRVRRIITDHVRSIVFIIGDGVDPDKKAQGAVLKRLIRRIMTYSYLYLTKKIRTDTLFNYENVIEATCKEYTKVYNNLDFRRTQEIIRIEYTKFDKVLVSGITELKKFFSKFISGVDPMNPGSIIIKNNVVSGRGLGIELFNIYQSKGLHPDIARDILEQWGLLLDDTVVKEYATALRDAEKTHREISRSGSQKKFGGHGLLLDTGELKAGDEEELKKATRLHTATHLLHAALRKVLGGKVHPHTITNDMKGMPEGNRSFGVGVQQAGSDITAERLRFDFTFPRKMTPEEIKQVEDIINDAVKADYLVTKKEMPYEEAIKSGALAFFKLKYPPKVNVYTIGSDDAPFSRELCGGPHVSRTSEIGTVKITKEEAVSAGVRRIRAIVT